MLPTAIHQTLASDLSERARKFPNTIPYPWPNRFCNPPKRPAFGKIYDLERERLERLAMAIEHLERAAVTGHNVDRQANWAISIVYFQSAVEGLKVVWEHSPWQAVRHDIAHQLKLQKVTELAGGGSSFKKYGMPPLSGEDSGESPDELPMTDKKATPMFDFREAPSGPQINDLGWHIREVRTIVALSSMGDNESKFIDWEDLMVEISGKIWCDWTIDKGAKFLEHPRSGLGPMTRDSPAPVEFPLNFESAWEGYLTLLNTDDRLIRDWLLDEWLVWSHTQVRFHNWRRERLIRLWNPTCRLHCRKYGWHRSVPMCEAFQLSENECAETAESGMTVPQTVKEFMQPYLPKSTPYL